MSATHDMSKEHYNIELANRQIEINEWSYNNKMDTLFVFQILFISLALLSVLFYFKGQGLVGGSFVWYAFVIVVLLFVLLLVTRVLYSLSRIDKKEWSRRRFEGNNAMIPPPIKPGDTAFEEYKKQVEKKYPVPGKPTPSCTCD